MTEVGVEDLERIITLIVLPYGTAITTISVGGGYTRLRCGFSIKDLEPFRIWVGNTLSSIAEGGSNV